RNPFTAEDYTLMAEVGIIGFLDAFNDPLSKNGIINISTTLDLPFLRRQYAMIFMALSVLISSILSRIICYDKVVRDRMFAVVLLAFFLIFFFMRFEQGATSLVLVARDYIDRSLTGGALTTFNIVNGLLTIVPLGIISWVLIKLAQTTWKKI